MAPIHDRLRELIAVYVAAKSYIESLDPSDYENLVEAVKSATPEGMNVESMAASALGSIKSKRKAKSSRDNGKLGGRPRKNKKQ